MPRALRLRPRTAALPAARAPGLLSISPCNAPVIGRGIRHCLQRQLLKPSKSSLNHSVEHKPCHSTAQLIRPDSGRAQPLVTLAGRLQNPEHCRGVEIIGNALIQACLAVTACGWCGPPSQPDFYSGIREPKTSIKGWEAHAGAVPQAFRRATPHACQW